MAPKKAPLTLKLLAAKLETVEASQDELYQKHHDDFEQLDNRITGLEYSAPEPEPLVPPDDLVNDPDEALGDDEPPVFEISGSFAWFEFGLGFAVGFITFAVLVATFGR